jgi:hypothetical protein
VGDKHAKHPGLLFQGGARQTKRGTGGGVGDKHAKNIQVFFSRGAGFVVVSFFDKLKSNKVKRFALVLLQVRTLL